MFVFKCLPVVGTAINAVEAVAAACEGDGKKCASKLVQTGVGAALDTAFVMSGGFSSLMTTPLQGAAIEGGKVAGKKVVQHLVVREAGKLTTNVAVRGAAEYLAYKYAGSGVNHSWNRNEKVGHDEWSTGTTTVVLAKGFYSVGDVFDLASGGSGNHSSNRNERRIRDSGISSSITRGLAKGFYSLGDAISGGGGSGNDPPRGNPRLPREHELEQCDFDAGISLLINGFYCRP